MNLKLREHNGLIFELRVTTIYLEGILDDYGSHGQLSFVPFYATFKACFSLFGENWPDFVCSSGLFFLISTHFQPWNNPLDV